MGPYGNGNGKNHTAKIIALILFAVFLGPLIISVLGSLFIGLFSIALLLLVIALVLLSSPFLIMAFPASAGFNIPVFALFFFGVAVLALFVLVTAVILRMVKRLIIGLWRGLRRILG